GVDAGRVRDEGDRAEGGEGEVDAGVRQGQGAGVGDDGGHAAAGAPVELGGGGDHAGGDVGGEHLGAPPGEPARALGGAGADLEHPQAADIPEEAGLLLAQPLRAPAEVGVAEEGAVLVEVLGGVLAPPPAVRARRGGRVDLPEAHPAHARVLPVTAGPQWAASCQERPWPTETSRGTWSSAAAAIRSRTSASTVSSSPGATSRTSSSWTWSSRRELRPAAWRPRSTSTIATLMMSAALPWIGALSAIRSAMSRRWRLSLVRSGR